MTAPRVAISIVTRNRASELERTLHELGRLTPPPDEIWVYADACSDDTSKRVAALFPSIHLLSSDTARGSIHGRDLILRSTDSEIVLTLDDDSHPIETDFISRLRTLHADRPQAAVFTFPQVSEEYPASIRDSASIKNVVPQRVASFTNSGASYWREFYLKLPGFVPEFVHAYEEPDYALQCFSAGLQVISEPSLTIRHHYTSVNRNPLRTHLSHCRNETWSVLLRAPWPLVPVLTVFRALRQLENAARLGGWLWVKNQPRWWWATLSGAGMILGKRQPVSLASYWGWLRLFRAPQPA
jgi:GT2 family glycosyltransferase